MPESHINAGNQSITDDLSELKYSVSVTDACIDWEATDKLLHNLHDLLQQPLSSRQPACLRLETHRLNQFLPQ